MQIHCFYERKVKTDSCYSRDQACSAQGNFKTNQSDSWNKSLQSFYVFSKHTTVSPLPKMQAAFIRQLKELPVRGVLH